MGDPELASALTSFSPFHAANVVLTAGAAATAESTQSSTFVERLRTEYGIVVRNTSVPVIGSTATHHPLRISTHLFHSRTDVDRLVAAMQDLTARMLSGR
jgi:selenocysteine lyase/cysteine desulfurase